MSCVIENGNDGEEEALEAALTAVAERRDRKAFQRLFAFYGPRVKAYALGLGRDDAAAEALMQEVLLAIWQRAGRFDRRRMVLSAWVYAIARDMAGEASLRGLRPDVEASDPAARDEPYKPAQDETTAGPGPVRQAVVQAIERMPEEELNLLRAFYRVGATDADASAGTRRGDATLVPARVRPVLDRLRRLLGGTSG